ncbi:hypothetical protein KI688_001179 [Linnemannia hyalina]|uniref:HCP-like protein n=1 Tax=Linnemannia hyalina TaxID=64524 RepID=A0A9P7Y4P9_9FUNG|nr:hypothetical protein KI688_001179 [Linnemannia hyalina]
MAAEQGHAQTQTSVGYMYQSGQAVAQDYAEAMRRYRRAADQEEAAAHNIGRLYLYGLGVTQDYTQAMEWFEKAADQGDGDVQEHHPPVQAIRPVCETGQTMAPANITHIVCHPDSSSSGKDVILWDDIKAAFGDVALVRSGSIVQAFLKGRDFKNLDPLRIAAVPGATLEVVIRGQPARTESAVQQTTSNRASLQELSRDALQETQKSARPSKYSYIRNPIPARPRRTLKTASTQQLSTTIGTPNTCDVPKVTPLSPPQPASEEPVSGSVADFISTMVTARSGCQDAQAGLGAMYMDGIGVSQDYKQAMEWLLKAAEQGSASAQCNIGIIYENGKGVPQDSYKAALWHAKAAEQEQRYAQHNLGCLYRDGRGVPKDEVKAAELFTKAAEQGHSDAQESIGVAYEKGRGVPQDHVKAAEWYLKSAEQGNSFSQHKLGTLYRLGHGLEQDHGHSLVWYRKAAEQGCTAAMCAIGYNYHYGHGVTQDYTQAMEWYIKAADLGSPAAQNNIASMYDDGQGVPQDYETAMDWFLKAAEQGLAAAQNSLGVMYQYGQGVLQDCSLAVEWYREAADQGHVDAQFNLGNMYEDGEGVEVDKTEAMMWYQKSAEQGNTNAKKRLQILINFTSLQFLVPFLDGIVKVRVSLRTTIKQAGFQTSQSALAGVGGHEEAAMENYNHTDNSATAPLSRGPQTVLGD